MRLAVFPALLFLCGCNVQSNRSDQSDNVLSADVITEADLVGSWAENGHCGSGEMRLNANGTWQTEMLNETVGGQWRVDGGRLIVVTPSDDGNPEGREVQIATITAVSQQSFTLSYEGTPAEIWERCP